MVEIATVSIPCSINSSKNHPASQNVFFQTTFRLASNAVCDTRCLKNHRQLWRNTQGHSAECSNQGFISVFARPSDIGYRMPRMIGQFMQIALLFLCIYTTYFSSVVETLAKGRADGRHTSCDTSPGPSVSAPRSTVDLGWTGTDAISINIPAQVEYQPASRAEATVNGNPDLVSHVRLIDGKLVWDTEDHHPCIAPADLIVHIVGPSVAAWRIHGIGQLKLNNVSQDTIQITKHGTGSVTASGDVKEIVLRAAGTGSADLSRLKTQRASVHIHGSGEVDLTPSEDAEISITGHAILRVHGDRAKLHVRSHGSARVIQVPAP